MIPFLLIIAEISILYLLTGRVQQYVYTLILNTTRSKKIATAGISALLYPGTVVHELSHLLLAVVLFVPVEKLELYPKEINGKILAGSVTTAKCDILRRTIIGIAPLLTGLAVLYFLAAQLFPNIIIETSDLFLIRISQFPLLNFQFKSAVVLYLIFSVSATMYSSRKDLESFIIVGPVMALIVLVMYFAGFQFEVFSKIIEASDLYFAYIALALSIPIAIHAVVYLLLSINRLVK